MAMLLKKWLLYGGYSLLHNFYLIIWWRKKGKGTEEWNQLKQLITKIQEMTSNAAITEKVKNNMSDNS